NYVMLEMGQPNHTFDYDFLRRRADEYAPDGPIEIITRLPHEGETLTTLDGHQRDLPDFTILVTDRAGALSLGGIMGGEDSEINDETTNVLLEAAAWDFINIRRSMDALKINSEAGFRFSRGVHPAQAMRGARRAAELMRRLAGGAVWQGIVDTYPNPPEQAPVVLTAAEVARIGGITPSQKEIAEMLRALEFEVDDAGDHLLVTAPDHRLDIEGSHDLVEEVCRVYGYDRIPETEMSDTLPPQRNNPDLETEELIRDTLVELGLQEIITYRLTTPEEEARLLPPDAPADDRPYVALANPITVDRVVMRHSLLSSALEVLAENSRFKERIALFEIGQVYLGSEDGLLPEELRRLSIVLTGPRRPAHWTDDEPPAYDFYDLTGLLASLLEALHIGEDQWRLEPARHPTYRPGRCARLMIGDRQLGHLGELHPIVVERLDARNETPILATELDVEALQTLIPDRHQVSAVSQYPAVHEDLALVVDANLPAATVSNAIEDAGGFLLKNVQLFDVYTGSPIPDGKKSLAYHLTFQAPDKTLTDKQVHRQRQRILQQLEKQLGARLRE
ncbi:MAG: phenylalanine--tRNA ligase subunit beta, partial [Chloroflexota bacterium]